MELLNALGLDLRLLIAQWVNFAVLVLILYKFAYQPVLNMLESRTQKIEKGLSDALESEKKLASAKEQSDQVLEAAKEEAKRIIAEAEHSGKKYYETAMQKALVDTQELLETSRKRIDEERKKAISDARAELGEIVVTLTEKVLREKIDSEKDMVMIHKTVGEMEK